MSNSRDSWEAFLNPDVVRSRIISAGLFLIAYEMLKDSIKRHLRSFFFDFSKEGDIPSSEYETEVLSIDPKGKKDSLRGSIAWLRKMEAISHEDEAAFHKVTDARNDIAHEMAAMVSAADIPNFESDFQILMALLNKIERWWIVNLEIPTNPDFDDKEINEEGIIPGPAWIMDLLSRIALGTEDEAWEAHRIFTEKWPRGTNK